MANLKFEEALARLETIVAELEKGDLPLNDSLKIFEEGIRLSKTCLKMLDDAERKVEVIVQEQDGKKRLRAFSLDSEVSSSPDEAQSSSAPS
ncbi:MAG: exodeoxyribonuclease VII small subunit [Nitrospirae bacterium]|nr:MAG: exodeoxyribonuclease VII small subunit [Nitrospirota bacterium]